MSEWKKVIFLGEEFMKEDEINKQINDLIEDARKIIEKSRSNAVRSVDFCRVQMYWNLGKRILEEEQQGKDRADYGIYLIKNLAKKLEKEYGSGFGIRQLERARQFFKMYPIASTLQTQLNWSQYKLLISISDSDKREYYELEAINNNWTGRELERQINSQLYERLLLSNDKESVLAVARKERIPEKPTEIIKDPMILEFLGLERKTSYYEKDLESAIISHIADFLLEMGKGFSFVARQQRILLEEDEYEENPTIGILLCSSKNDTAVKMALPENNNTILASEYQLYLPTSEELVKEINEVKQLAQEIEEEK